MMWLILYGVLFVIAWPVVTAKVAHAAHEPVSLEHVPVAAVLVFIGPVVVVAWAIGALVKAAARYIEERFL